MFNKKEKKYSVLYKNDLGVIKVQEYLIIWSKNDLRKDLLKKNIFPIKIIDIDTIFTKAHNATWTDKQLYEFTNYLRLEFSKSWTKTVSEKMAIAEVHKKTFDPVVYAILVELKENKRFNEVIQNYPNIFDTIYVSTITRYFNNTSQPEEGLKKLEENIQERIAYKAKIIESTRWNIVTIWLIVILSFVMDIIIYERIKESFLNFWRPLPDFTIMYHNSLYLLIKLIWPVLILYWLFLVSYGNIRNKNIKIFLAKIKLKIPIIWDIHKKRTVYEFIDTFILMREWDVLQRDALDILSKSTSNYYLGEIIREVRSDTIKWIEIWESLEEFLYFIDWDEDVIFTLKSNWNVESLKSLRKVKKIELENLTDKSLRMIKTIAFIVTITLAIGMWNAYYKPVQMQSQLFQDQINEERLESVNN